MDKITIHKNYKKLDVGVISNTKICAIDNETKKILISRINSFHNKMEIEFEELIKNLLEEILI